MVVIGMWLWIGVIRDGEGERGGMVGLRERMG